MENEIQSMIDKVSRIEDAIQLLIEVREDTLEVLDALFDARTQEPRSFSFRQRYGAEGFRADIDRFFGDSLRRDADSFFGPP